MSLIWRKRIPSTGRAMLNLEESQNKSACQVRNFAASAPCDGRELRPEASQGSDEVNGNPAHLFWYPHSNHGAAGR